MACGVRADVGAVLPDVSRGEASILSKPGWGRAVRFEYLGDDYHQQYLQKVPWGYCPDQGTGVSCPIGLGVPSEVPVEGAQT